MTRKERKLIIDAMPSIFDADTVRINRASDDVTALGHYGSGQSRIRYLVGNARDLLKQAKAEQR